MQKVKFIYKFFGNKSIYIRIKLGFRFIILLFLLYFIIISNYNSKNVYLLIFLII